MAAEDANLRNWRFGTFGDLATRVRNYASRGRESANYGGAILLGLTALEWEERAQHSTLWRFVTLYYIVSQTAGFVANYPPPPHSARDTPRTACHGGLLLETTHSPLQGYGL
jgi:hypothetical protein